MTDISLEQAWEILAEDPSSTLIDVRTQAEWNFVGVPDLTSVSKEPALVEWTQYPAGERNPTFVEQATAAAPDEQAPVLLLCRSGARSRAAADVLTSLGYARTLNVVAGFEGNHDDQQHRTGGWKSSGLPWKQG